MSIKSFLEREFPELFPAKVDATPATPLTADEARARTKIAEDAKKAKYEAAKEAIAPKIKKYIDKRIFDMTNGSIYSITIYDYTLVEEFGQVGLDSFNTCVVPKLKQDGYKVEKMNAGYPTRRPYTLISWMQ